MDSTKFVTTVFDDLRNITVDQSIHLIEKYTYVSLLLQDICNDILKDETLQFSNLFSKLSFICNKYKVASTIHEVRITINQIQSKQHTTTEDSYVYHIKLISEFVSKIYKIAIPIPLFELIRSAAPILKSSAVVYEKLDKVRAVILEIHIDHLICSIDANLIEEATQVKVFIFQEGENDQFDSVDQFWIGAQLYLVNIRIESMTNFYPKMIVLEPDYLLDISAIAACFQDYGTSELHFLKSKFEPKSNSKYILLGNFANLVIDELFGAEDPNDVNFEQVFKLAFNEYPFEYTFCEDIAETDAFRSFMQDAKGHFERIKHILATECTQYGITPNKAMLEPSFICELYGIQGRLDVLQIDSKEATKIIELKSGSVPFPDNGKDIKPNHLMQLYMYYLLISNLHQLDFNKITTYIEGFILYSKVSKNNLRISTPVLKRIQQILEIRNRIILNEHLLSSGNQEAIYKLLLETTSENLIQHNVNEKFKNILTLQFIDFLRPITNIHQTVKAYFTSFVSYIAREHYISKLGVRDQIRNNGLANLWILNQTEKRNIYEILCDLEIVTNQIDKEQKCIYFRRTNRANEFVNFRVGDICVLYPCNQSTDNVTKHQIFKGTITSLTKESVVVSFRFKQRNIDYFSSFDTEDAKGKWAIERDVLDNGMTNMYKNLYAFISAPIEKQKLLLTITPPRKANAIPYFNNQLSSEQNKIINKCLATQDYFLLNGPPGTGKTSIIIKELVAALVKDPNHTVLLLAYTNKAVDELCDALLSIERLSNTASDTPNTTYPFIRIGSSLACEERFQPYLLSTLSKESSSRNSLRKTILNTKIIVANVAAMSTKSELFELLQFDTLILDEASQVLEPQIIGFLTKVKRFIMVGDHKQLPAISLQQPNQSRVDDPQLHAIGLYNHSHSLFERLYNYCVAHEYVDAYDIITHQGRMHQAIAAFPNETFYDGLLKLPCDDESIAPDIYKKLDLDRQKRSLNYAINPALDKLGNHIREHRLLFMDVPSALHANLQKFSVAEANMVVHILKQLLLLFGNSGIELANKVGVIAPFKNQIALIKQLCEAAGIPNYQSILIDTVERFQGSQRDIIILSTTVNTERQLQTLIAYNELRTVDRKLNVAITRAREQMLIIGDSKILNLDKTYQRLIAFIKENGCYQRADQ